MKSVTHSIFKTFLLSVLVVAQMHFAYAQTASILPPAKTTFLDANGKPLTAGTVESFIPATTTHKTTWQDAAETIPNANPLTLDAAGRALLLGSGSYRQVVKDRLNNVIWDQVTSSTGSGGGGGTASTGDGDLVGTIKPWAGMTAPNQYVFTYGQEVSRTTFPALFTAITSTQSIFCNSGSPILNGLGDTTNFWVGMTVELSCLGAGFSIIISKTATTVTLAANANVTTNTNAIFFPWGRGNGITTFNLPDFRGQVLAGNNIMGGIASSNLNATYFGTQTPNATGAAGGNQNATLLSSNLANPNSIISGIAVSNGPLTINGNAFNGGCVNATGGCTGGAQADFMITTTGSTSVGPSSSSVSVSSQGTISSLTGGIAVSATIGSVGSGYTNGAQTITIAGGTCTIQPQFTVTIAGNIFTGSPVLLTAGNCTVAPTNPAATTGGSGTGGTLNVTYSAQPFSLIQPTKTVNYIIKTTPDDNSATASGVTALGGMTGSIACGAGLLCTGNNINTIPLSVGSTFNGGVSGRVLFDNAGILGEYSISGSGSVAMTTSPTLITPIIAQIFGGTAAGSSITLSATNNGAPSGEVANISAHTVNITGAAGSATTINLGASGSSTGFITLAGSSSGAVTLQSTAAASGTLTLPNGADTLIGKATTDTLTNKTINGGTNTFCLPNRQVFITGINATYTTPTCNAILPTRVEIEMVGGGAGSGGSGSSGQTAGGVGGNTCWNTSSPACTTPVYVANGGTGGTVANNTNGAGGSAASCDLNLVGGAGGFSSSNANATGGIGGISFFGGSGVSGNVAAGGGAPAANTGSGAGGPGFAGALSGGGGGAGGYCRKIQTSPASSYFYTVGAAGTAGGVGTSGAAGTAGSIGLIIATAYWQ